MVCCGSHHLCLPQPPVSLAEGCWVAALVIALPASTSLQSFYDIPSLKGSSVVWITKMPFLLVPVLLIGQWELLVTTHNPCLRNSAIPWLLFSSLIAGRPNMALFKCFCSCFIASWTFPCIQRELGLEWEPVAPHHGSWLLFSSLWGPVNEGSFFPGCVVPWEGGSAAPTIDTFWLLSLLWLLQSM